MVRKVIDGLTRLGFISREDGLDTSIHYEKYAYVIYDLHHRKKVDRVLAYLRGIGIRSAGRFAEFEYLNTDGVVERTLKLAREMNSAPVLPAAHEAPAR
jgi:protoporphyrinogen oxidase